MLFGVGFLRTARAAPRWFAALHNPDDVVWLFEQVFSVDEDGNEVPVGDTNIIACLADGGTIAICVKKAKALTLLNALHLLAPQAATGFSKERQNKFRVDPRALAGAGSV